MVIEDVKVDGRAERSEINKDQTWLKCRIGCDNLRTCIDESASGASGGLTGLPLVITEREDPTLCSPIPASITVSKKFPPRANIKCSAGYLDLSDVGLDIHGEANFP